MKPATTAEAWVRNKMGRRLPDITRPANNSNTEDIAYQSYSRAIAFTGFIHEGTRAVFELENGGVAVVPFPAALRGK